MTPDLGASVGRGTPVDAALAALDGIAERPVAEHVAVYDEVHRLLQDALAAVDDTAP